MKLIETGLEGLKIVELKFHRDSRGFLVERFNQRSFTEAGLPEQFVQENHSRSLPHILRGMHFQLNPPVGKLVGVIRGAIWDVAVDIRPSSPTFKKSFGIELSESNERVLWIPAGFAHGFCVLGNEPADVLYKMTSLYHPQGEGGIRWNDSDLNISWPYADPLVSERDASLPSFQAYLEHHKKSS